MSIEVTPATASVPITGGQFFTATAIYSDGSTSNVTTSSTWSSGTLGVATVGLNTGIATGVASGTSVITATFGGMTNSATLTVTAATSTMFQVIPAPGSIPVSGTQQFTAIETFSDGTNQNRTGVSVWTSPDLSGTGVATVGDNTGLATGTAVGTSTITATYTVSGVTKIATAILTVNAARSVSFVVRPALASIPVTGTQQYTAIETFSDGTSFDRTLISTWSSDNATVATVAVDNGIATGRAVGTSRITATYAGSPFSPASATLTVTAPTPGPAGPAVNLGLASTYGIIAYDAITVGGLSSHIYGDVALTQPGPGGTIASVTGPGTNNGGVAPLLTSTVVTTSDGVTPGMITAANNGSPTNIAALPQLLIDLGAAYDDLLNRAAPVTPLTTPASVAAAVGGGTFATAPNLSGYVFGPGIYTTTGMYGLSDASGPLVLDGKGNPDAVFVIRSTSAASGFTSTTGSVVLRNGAQSKNIFWLVVGNATIGTRTFFQGTLVAGQVITLDTFANVEGRMLAGALGTVSGAITLSGTNVIVVPAP